MAEGILLPPGAGEPVYMGPHSSGEMKITGRETDDAFCLWELSMAPGRPQVPVHLHREIHEFMFVLAGELLVTLGEKTVAAGPGTFSYAPPGTLHGFHHIAGERARALICATPAGPYEAILNAVHALFAGGPPDAAKLASAFPDLDIQFP